MKRLAWVIPNLAVSFSLCAVLSGCGDSLPPVQSVELTVTMDGKPFGPASFLLIPAGQEKLSADSRSVAGTSDANGIVTLTTFAKGDGAPAGEYNVQFVPSVSSAPPKPIPALYMNATSSPLKLSVKADEPTIEELSLVSKPKMAGASAAAAAAMGSSMPNRNYPPISTDTMPAAAN